MANPRICSIPGCSKKHVARGWCSAHYQRWQEYGDPLHPTQVKRNVCAVAGCDSLVHGKGYCRPHYKEFVVRAHGACIVEGCNNPVFSIQKHMCAKHYGRVMKHGTTDSLRTPNGATAKFIDEVCLTYSQDNCLAWTYSVAHVGYGKAWYRGKRRKASRIVCVLAHGEPPTREHEAAHNCGNASCVNPRHLRWATPLQNSADKVKHGTMPRGEHHPSAKLTRRAVDRIKKARSGSLADRKMASEYGVSPATIHAIRTGRTWKD